MPARPQMALAHPMPWDSLPMLYLGREANKDNKYKRCVYYLSSTLELLDSSLRPATTQLYTGGFAGPSLRRPVNAAQAAEAAAQSSLPGFSNQQSVTAADVDVEAFLRGQAQKSAIPTFSEFDSIYASGGVSPLAPPEASNTLVLAPSLRAFFDSSKAQAPFRPVPLPAVSLTIPDQCRIRDRSTILARQVFSERGDLFADQQVHALLASLNIDPSRLPSSAASAPGDWDTIFSRGRIANETAMSASMAAQQQYPATAWADEYTNTISKGWAEEYKEKELDRSGWAEEYGTVQRDRDAEDAMVHTRRLAETLAADNNPKMQNSKFLQFVSKMSRGEVILEDNAVKEVPATAAAWATEFANGQQTSWASEYTSAGGFNEMNSWADQFLEEGNNTTGATSNWEEEYMKEIERLHTAGGPSAYGGYVLAENNPFLTDSDSYSKGRELFKAGILNEAVLALEAECQRNPSNSEAWRLLGTVQAENDDDKQAIAAMNRALAADPQNPEVLLSLGVSHTNELDQDHAIYFLEEWLLAHPKFGSAARSIRMEPSDSSQRVPSAIRMFEFVANGSGSQDADVQIALGVLCNVSRRYEEAAERFRAASVARPADYSIWNKLGATLANSGHSAEALAAYRKALELKPNYVRAWSNMGISLANLSDYEGSARYYVRALSLNPKASSVWSYLRNSLLCGGKTGLLDAADNEDLAALQSALPLQ